jgi:hypothetical protein
MPRSASSANRRGAALLSAAFAVTACTSILGIDGDYYAEHANSGGSTGGDKTSGTGGKTSGTTHAGGASSPTHLDAGSGGRPGSGGVPSSGGGTQDASAGGRMIPGGGGTETTGSGGSSTGGRENGGGGGTSESGGNGANGGEGGSTAMPRSDSGPPPVCPLGTYMGTYTGNHRPSTGITMVAARITGSITLRFTATNASQRAITGGVAYLATATSGGFAGTFLGTYDCETEMGSVSLIDPTDITTINPPEVAVPVDGTFTIQPGPNGGLKGSFSIYESLNHAATGSGSWATN